MGGLSGTPFPWSGVAIPPAPHALKSGQSPHAPPLFQGRQSLPGPPGRPLAHGARAPQTPIPGAHPDLPPRQQHPQQQGRPPPPPGGLRAARTPAGTLLPTARQARPCSCKSLRPLGLCGATDCGGRKPSRPGWGCSVPPCPSFPIPWDRACFPHQRPSGCIQTPPSSPWSSWLQLRSPAASQGLRAEGEAPSTAEAGAVPASGMGSPWLAGSPAVASPC